jgi:N-acetyl-anhydromuramyl-L-alanine amidase AmpD
MEIKVIDFPENQYFKQPQKKTAIVLHHTVSHGKHGVDGAVQQWLSTPTHEGTAFIIGEDGSINQVFSPEFWACHLFRHSANEPAQLYQIEKCTIGIEIVNAGPLTKRSSSIPTESGCIEKTEYLWFDGQHVYDGPVYTHPEAWRGTQYYATYTDAQYNALNQLLDKLCADFNIKRDIVASYAFIESFEALVLQKEHQLPGIWNHHNFRKDKSDVSVAFDYKRIAGVNLIGNLPELQGVIGETTNEA